MFPTQVLALKKAQKVTIDFSLAYFFSNENAVESTRDSITRIKYKPRSKTESETDSDDESISPSPITSEISDEFCQVKQQEIERSATFNKKATETLITQLAPVIEGSQEIFNLLNQADWYHICRSMGPVATVAGVAASVFGGPAGIVLEQAGAALSKADTVVDVWDRRAAITSQLTATLETYLETAYQAPLSDLIRRGVLPYAQTPTEDTSSEPDWVLITLPNNDHSNSQNDTSDIDQPNENCDLTD